jgi:hypothetical protein
MAPADARGSSDVPFAPEAVIKAGKGASGITASSSAAAKSFIFENNQSSSDAPRWLVAGC